MAVSYKRLWIKLAEKEMSRADLRKKAEIAPNTMTKLGKNEYVAMPILDKICKHWERIMVRLWSMSRIKKNQWVTNNKYRLWDK